MTTMPESGSVEASLRQLAKDISPAFRERLLTLADEIEASLEDAPAFGLCFPRDWKVGGDGLDRLILDMDGSPIAGGSEYLRASNGVWMFDVDVKPHPLVRTPMFACSLVRDYEWGNTVERIWLRRLQDVQAWVDAWIDRVVNDALFEGTYAPQRREQTSEDAPEEEHPVCAGKGCGADLQSCSRFRCLTDCSCGGSFWCNACGSLHVAELLQRAAVDQKDKPQ